MIKTKMSFTVDTETSKEFEKYTNDREINRSYIINKLIKDWLLYQEQENLKYLYQDFFKRF